MGPPWIVLPGRFGSQRAERTNEYDHEADRTAGSRRAQGHIRPRSRISERHLEWSQSAAQTFASTPSPAPGSFAAIPPLTLTSTFEAKRCVYCAPTLAILTVSIPPPMLAGNGLARLAVFDMSRWIAANCARVRHNRRFRRSARSARRIADAREGGAAPVERRAAARRRAQPVRIIARIGRGLIGRQRSARLEKRPASPPIDEIIAQRRREKSARPCDAEAVFAELCKRRASQIRVRPVRQTPAAMRAERGEPSEPEPAETQPPQFTCSFCASEAG